MYFMTFGGIYDNLFLLAGSIWLSFVVYKLARVIYSDWASHPRLLQHWLVVFGAVFGIAAIFALAFLLWPSPTGTGIETGPAYISIISAYLWGFGAREIWKAL